MDYVRSKDIWKYFNTYLFYEDSTNNAENKRFKINIV